MWKYSRAPFAQENLETADEPSQAVNDLGKLAERIATLQTSVAAMRPEYELSSPRTIGGVPSASAYRMAVPFASPCEVSIVCVTNTDDTTAATLTLSLDPNLDISTSNLATMTATLDGNQGFLFIASVLTSLAVGGSHQWYPLSGESAIYVRVNGAGSKAAYFTLAFRRRINAFGVQVASARG